MVKHIDMGEVNILVAKTIKNILKMTRNTIINTITENTETSKLPGAFNGKWWIKS